MTASQAGLTCAPQYAAGLDPCLQLLVPGVCADEVDDGHHQLVVLLVNTLGGGGAEEEGGGGERGAGVCVMAVAVVGAGGLGWGSGHSTCDRTQQQPTSTVLKVQTVQAACLLYEAQ